MNGSAFSLAFLTCIVTGIIDAFAFALLPRIGRGGRAWIDLGEGTRVLTDPGHLLRPSTRRRRRVLRWSAGRDVVGEQSPTPGAGTPHRPDD